MTEVLGTLNIEVGGERVVLLPGDTLDLGPVGYVAYYTDPEADAMRMLAVERAQRTRAAIEFARARERAGANETVNPDHIKE